MSQKWECNVCFAVFDWNSRVVTCSSRKEHKWCAGCIRKYAHRVMNIYENGMRHIYLFGGLKCCSFVKDNKKIINVCLSQDDLKLALAREDYQKYVNLIKARNSFATQRENYMRKMRLVRRKRFVDVECAREYVEFIATTKCPKCLTAFDGYLYCAHVMCSTCGVEFCGNCVEATSENCPTWHDHMVMCPWNLRGQYSSQEHKEMINKRRFRTKVEEFLSKCASAKFHNDVVDRCRDIFERHFQCSLPKR